MNPGLLNQRIQIEALNDTKDALGHSRDDWRLHRQCWANIKPLKSKENYSDKEISTSTVYQIKIRYLRDITRKMRIQWQGKVLEIIGDPINENNKNRYTVIEAQHG